MTCHYELGVTYLQALSSVLGKYYKPLVIYVGIGG